MNVAAAMRTCGIVRAERDRDRYDNGYRDRDSRYGDRRDYPNNQYPNNYR